MADKKDKNNGSSPNPAQSNNEVSFVKLRASRLKRVIILLGIVLVTIAIIAGGVKFYKYQNRSLSERVSEQLTKVNQSLAKGDKQKALEHAKKALELYPDNNDLVYLVASITSDIDPNQAEKEYDRLYEDLKTQHNLDNEEVSTIIYWAAANAAEDAGEIEDARKYYQKVIQKASPEEYEQDIARQSRERLEKLQ